MAQRAEYLFACVFVKTPASKLFVKDAEGQITDVLFENLTEEEARVYVAVQDAFNLARVKYGNFHYVLNLCPLDYADNTAVTHQAGLYLLPAAIIEATYPQGNKKRYALGKDLDDKLFGANWKPESVYPYLRILLLNEDVGQPSKESFLCDLFPPLCSVGGWVWLSLALAATYKTTQAQNVGKVLWGGASAVLWKEYIDRGGLDHLKSTLGIGKVYDHDSIKPGTRIDKYWGKLAPAPREMGVDAHKGAHFHDAHAAIQHFNLYALEFGNWMNQQDRINFLYGATVSMRDMATVVGIPQKKMGLRGRLSISFGGRGHGRAAAHYQGGSYIVINLTKTNGPGSFAHEWAHAVDDFFGGASGWRETRKQPDYRGLKPGTPAYMMEEILDGVLWNQNGTPSTYQNWLAHQSEYYNRRTEIFARITERFFHTEFKKAGINNTYAVEGRPGPDWPALDLVNKVAPKLKQLFKHI